MHIAHEKKDNLELDVDKDEMLHRIFVRHPKSETPERLRQYFGVSEVIIQGIIIMFTVNEQILFIQNKLFFYLKLYNFTLHRFFFKAALTLFIIILKFMLQNYVIYHF